MESSYKNIQQKDIDFFKSILHDINIIYEREKLEFYSKDHTEDLQFFPEIVLIPTDEFQVSEIVEYCNNNLIPITASGARTGLSGGALSVKGGVILSVEKLNKIHFLDEKNMQVTVGPGVINEVLKNHVAKKNLFYPPDPASQGSSFIGGNVAENAGGPKALKYGVTKDYVLNLQVVLANGEIIWTGANVLKNSTGYNLTQLLVGSEGTLGIITKIVLKLIPLPKSSISLLAPFTCIEKATEVVSHIFNEGISPCALEFMEIDAIRLANKYSEHKLEINDNIKAHLLIELDGNDMQILLEESEKIYSVLEKFECGEIILADTLSHQNRIWKLRRFIGEAVKMHSIYKEEDTVVPRAELPSLIKGVKKIGKKYGFNSVCYGHAGDGNLHINILKENMSDDKWKSKIDNAIREIFELTVSLNGTISGEHGIGYVQKKFIDIAFDKNQIKIQKKIKCIFDPNRILNPDKIFN